MSYDDQCQDEEEMQDHSPFPYVQDLRQSRGGSRFAAG